MEHGSTLEKDRQPEAFVIPDMIGVDVSSRCQLDCLLCRTIDKENRIIGLGQIRADQFRRIIENNPFIRRVELSNWGEVFLNRDLPAILKCAHENGVVTEIDEGANLNHASEEALEAVVKYQTRRIRCAVDGVSVESYKQHRVGGDLRKVVRNIQRINHYKAVHESEKPELILQFVVFGHNQHEIERVSVMAQLLKMRLDLKLNIFSGFSPVEEDDLVKRFIRSSSREAFRAQTGRHYMRKQCYHMWRCPQVNWDGKLLGCRRNIWLTYHENVFKADLLAEINNERMQYARGMLMGRVPVREDIPCVNCGVFKTILESEDWITEEEIEANSHS